MGIANSYNMIGNGGNTGPAVLPGLDAHLFNGSACLEWLLRQCHGDRPVCPHCGIPLPEHQHDRFYAAGKLRCTSKTCSRWFSGRTGTLLQGAQLKPGQIVAIVLLLALGQPIRDIAGFAGVDLETVRRWAVRLDTQFREVKLA